jgi:hypothetical protein
MPAGAGFDGELDNDGRWEEWPRTPEMLASEPGLVAGRPRCQCATIFLGLALALH